MSFGKSIPLRDGNAIPALGYGTWLAEPGQVGEGIKLAVKAGYRHLDLAKIYENQDEVGAALKELFDQGVVKRQDLFITSKVWNNRHAPEHVEPALDETLKELGLSYLDLYLIHVRRYILFWRENTPSCLHASRQWLTQASVLFGHADDSGPSHSSLQQLMTCTLRTQASQTRC